MTQPKLDDEALEAAAKAGREAIRPFQRLNPGENGAQSSLEWEEMQEVYQRPFRQIARAAITAYLAKRREQGFAEMPREPTDAMDRAGRAERRRQDDANISATSEIYEAMFDAASPPSPKEMGE